MQENIHHFFTEDTTQVPSSSEEANTPVTDNSSVDTQKETKEEKNQTPPVINWYDKYLRLYSDFENFRKRAQKEKIQLITHANEAMLKEILPILDDFERSIHAFTQENTDVKAIKSGTQLIYDKLFNILSQNNLKVMSVQPGDTFNAELHEAITQTPTENEAYQGKIIDVVSKGYMLDDKVIRFAKVIIGK